MCLESTVYQSYWVCMHMAGSRWHPPSNPTGICLVPSTLNSCTASQIEAKFLSIFAEGYIFVKHCYQNKSLNSKEREWIFFEMKHLHKGTYCRAPLIFEMEADISTNFCCHFFLWGGVFIPSRPSFVFTAHLALMIHAWMGMIKKSGLHAVLLWPQMSQWAIHVAMIYAD